MSVLDRQISTFENCKSVHGTDASLIDWLQDNSEEVTIDLIRSIQDEATRSQLKKTVAMCQPSGIFSGRDKLMKHSGLICLDIDYKANRHITNFGSLKAPIATAPFVAYVSTSISGEGYFVIIPIDRPEQHLGHFYALEALFAKLGIVIDPSCKDVTRPRFKSYDPAPYINHHAAIFRPVLTPKTVERRQNPEDVEKSRELVEIGITEVVKREIDLAPSYESWRNLGFALGSEFGEVGRDYFHQLSQFYPNYSFDECDAQYNRSLKEKTDKVVRIGTLFKMFTDVGIHVSALKDFKDLPIE